MSEYKIRKAVKEDCKCILGYIKELAEFEKMLDDVKISSEDLERDGFGDKPLYQCLVAEENTGNKVVAYCFYYPMYSTFAGRSIYLEDLYVTPEHRGFRLASSLIRHLSKIELEKGCAKIRFAVLEWNERAYEIYKYLEADDLTEAERWRFMTWNQEAVKKLASVELPPNIHVDMQ
ncbi:thialysine N-epsilon-acetyltransferase-like [Tubulanus polymorphus]|uniref:thialysine N-epsilon-acetyltransferase-like n=1 Tax=Tubulanus polymorphus TaxID=672921 RepID=UPI003DA4DD15